MADENQTRSAEDAQSNDRKDAPAETPAASAAAESKVLDEYKEKWQRALADYQNLLKETARQREAWATMSERGLLEEFLPVYSNFKKAFSVQRSGNSDDSWAKGIGFIMKQFGDVLKAHGIEEIKTVGEMFDAVRHEAVGEEESDQPEHTIIREVESGYTMNDQVIKVAKVIVSKKIENGN